MVFWCCQNISRGFLNLVNYEVGLGMLYLIWCFRRMRFISISCLLTPSHSAPIRIPCFLIHTSPIFICKEPILKIRDKYSKKRNTYMGLSLQYVLIFIPCLLLLRFLLFRIFTYRIYRFPPCVNFKIQHTLSASMFEFKLC
jgi:hypothetical protein